MLLGLCLSQHQLIKNSLVRLEKNESCAYTASGKAGFNRLNPGSFSIAGLCGRLEVAKVQELGVGGKIAAMGGDGQCAGLFSPAEYSFFSDGETETLGRKKDLSHRILHKDLSTLPSTFARIHTTTQENHQPKYLPNRFIHNRPEMAPRGQILSRGRVGPCRLWP